MLRQWPGIISYLGAKDSRPAPMQRRKCLPRCVIAGLGFSKSTSLDLLHLHCLSSVSRFCCFVFRPHLHCFAVPQQGRVAGSMKGCQLQGGKFTVPVVWGTEEGPASKQRPKWYLKLLPGPSLVGNESFSIHPWHGRAVHEQSTVETRSCRQLCHPSITYSYSSLHIISLSLDMLAASITSPVNGAFLIYARALQRIQSSYLPGFPAQFLARFISPKVLTSDRRLCLAALLPAWVPTRSAPLSLWMLNGLWLTSQETSSDSRRLRSGIESILRDQEALNQCCVLQILGFLDHNFGEFEFAASVGGPTRGNSCCHGRHPFFSQSLRAIW